MRLGDANTVYVFGWTWWPFDGAVTAALIALLGTAITIGVNLWRFKVAEDNQTTRQTEAEDNQTARHNETIASTEKVSRRESLLTDLRRTEDALAGDNRYRWVSGLVFLADVDDDEFATEADKKRARAMLRDLFDRVAQSSGSAS